MSTSPKRRRPSHLKSSYGSCVSNVSENGSSLACSTTDIPVLSEKNLNPGRIPDELKCPLCRQLFTRPRVTLCGHTFCCACVRSYVSTYSRCPSCKMELSEGKDFPNRAIEDFLSSVKLSLRIPRGIPLVKLSINDLRTFTLKDIESFENCLQKRKHQLTLDSYESKRILTVEFLKTLHRTKSAEKESLENELKIVNQDLIASARDSISCETDQTRPCSGGIKLHGQSVLSEVICDVDCPSSSKGREGKRSYDSSWKTVCNHFEDLSKVYWDLRKLERCFPQDSIPTSTSEDVVKRCQPDSNLKEFGGILREVSLCHRLSKKASLRYNVDLTGSAYVVWSVAFDKDDEFFAVAGSARNIKLFRYDFVSSSPMGSSCPLGELSSADTITCVSWNTYHKNNIVSAGFDRSVVIWDAAQGSEKISLKGHERKVWSVSWSETDPRILASASDDGTVRMWSSNLNRSPLMLQSRAKASICSVAFSPEQGYKVAFGSADNCVYLYDIRRPREPLKTYDDHGKTVTSVRFLSREELISSSVDGLIKLWEVERGIGAVRSFRGHKSEKHFNGLACDGKFIAAGSEDNSLYLYHKSLSKPLVSTAFDCHENVLSDALWDTSVGFVSALAWKKDSSVLLAANSKGFVNILEMD